MLNVEETQVYASWFNKLRDAKAKALVVSRIDRIAFYGSLIGDYKSVGDGVIELRFDFGPGYRVYVSLEKGRILLLLIGGNKTRQASDIEKAQKLLKQWRIDHGS